MNKHVTDIVSYLSWPGLLIAFFAGDRYASRFHISPLAVLSRAASNRPVSWMSPLALSPWTVLSVRQGSTATSSFFFLRGLASADVKLAPLGPWGEARPCHCRTGRTPCP